MIQTVCDQAYSLPKQLSSKKKPALATAGFTKSAALQADPME